MSTLQKNPPVESPSLPGPRPATVPPVESKASVPEPGRAEVYWGDWIAIRLWFLGLVLMGSLAIVNLVWGLVLRH
jgi:hypothetical protein